MKEVHKHIEIVGAAEHNLKSIDVKIQRGAITVITGVSGSGKSSLAFDTILAECQRRFFYTLSSYTKQFLDLGSRPKVKKISGLSPAIALPQVETQPSVKASVGSLTDLAELFGVLFSRFGEKLCPNHELPTDTISVSDIATRIVSEYADEVVAICAPVCVEKKGVFKAQLTSFVNKGYVRAFIDGEIVKLTPQPKLEREKKHTIKLIIDQIKVKASSKKRLERSLHQAMEEGKGYSEYYPVTDKKSLDLEKPGVVSLEGGCPQCGYTWPKLDARFFSRNSIGRCRACNGLGVIQVSESKEVLEQLQYQTCHECSGTGIQPQCKQVKVLEWSIYDVHSRSIEEVLTYIQSGEMQALSSNLAFKHVHEEIKSKLLKIIEMGLGYLSLQRRVITLSGGEAQRLKLSGVLSESLRGVVYILDEPSQGLHPLELERIWKSLIHLKELGNTVIIIDHDEFFMKKADYLIDLGPGGGQKGGYVVASFVPSKAKELKGKSKTASYLTQGKASRVSNKKSQNENFITLYKPQLHNLKIDKVRFSKGRLNVITGVSGAGKSSLAFGVLFPNLWILKNSKSKKVSLIACEKIEGIDKIPILNLIDRKSIAKTSVSIPATYLDVFSVIRKLYEKLPDAQTYGFTARSFSLNVEGGRCEECKGRGYIVHSMKFLEDSKSECHICHGQRYKSFVLQIQYNGLSIADVLNLTLDEALEHFKNHKKIVQVLSCASRLGLGYLKLGQPTRSLSGGESQRLKLVPFLSKKKDPGSIIMLDEPTRGLHFEDVSKLIRVLQEFAAEGVTIIVTEHNTDIILSADWIVDIGPGSSSDGGQLVFEGDLKSFLASKKSKTSLCLKEALKY